MYYKKGGLASRRGVELYKLNVRLFSTTERLRFPLFLRIFGWEFLYILNVGLI